MREIESLKLDFIEPDPAIYLLQMQNGYGKTTTLTLLKYIFTGQIPPKSLFSSFKYKKSFGGDPDKSEFWVKLSIADNSESEDIYDVGLIIDHVNNDARFQTVVPNMGLVNGWKLPSMFRRNFANKMEFVSLFLFDGEMAKQLNRSQGKDIIENSIRQVANLHPLFDLIEDNGQLQKVLESEFTIKNPNKQLVMYQNQKKKLEEHIQYVKKEMEKLKVEIDDIEKQIQDLQNEKDKLDSSQKEYAPKMEELQQQLGTARARLLQKTNETVNSLLNPAYNSNLWNCVRQFILSMEEARLPRSIGKRYIEDLLNQESCLCGRPWDEKSKEHVKGQMEYMLGDVLLGTVKSMQTEISDMGMLEPNAMILFRNSLQSLMTEIKNIEEEIKILRSQYDEEAVKKLNEIETKLRKLHSELSKKQETLHIMDTRDSDEILENGYDLDVRNSNGSLKHSPKDFGKCFNLFTLQKILDEINDKISELTQTRDIKEGHDAIKSIISQTLEVLMKQLRGEVIDLANNILNKMHATGGGMTIRSLENGLSFTNELGIDQEDVNVGAQLAAAYSYVAAMFSIGDIDVPLVLDSPVTGFSAGVCKDWAREIPPRFNQIIAFITSLEKIGIRSLLNSQNTVSMTIRRENEGLNGKPQTGKIIVDRATDFFINYEFNEEEN